MASPVQPPQDIQTDNSDQPGALNHVGPVQPGDNIDDV